jgi:tape measure domain-containing protein
MGVLSNLIVRIGASTDDFDKKINASLGKIQRFGASMSQAGQALSIGFSAPLIAAGAGALAAAADMEKLEKGLTATMKSSAAAGKELERLKVVSKLPGLGLQEAVQGSIRLQTLGSSADESRKIMMELGNALATDGGGKEDFKEVIRQLSQLSAVGKVTKENLDPIIERIPQIAAIMREKFGPESLGDPAKTFERLGISSKQFIDIIVAELGKGERSGATFANSLENLKESAFETAAEFGKSLLPIGKKVLEEFINPSVDRAKALAGAFNDLSPATQGLVIQLGAVATAAPLVIVALGTLIEKGGVVFAAINRVAGALSGLGVTMQVLGKAAGFTAIATGIYSLLEPLTRTETALNNQAKAAAQNKQFLDGLTKTYQDNLIAQGQLNPKINDGYENLLSFSRGVEKTKTEVQTLNPVIEKATELVQHYGRGVVHTYEAEFNSAVIKERLALLTAAYNQRLSDGVAALAKYGSAAEAANAALRELRITEEAPELRGSTVDIRNLPTPNVPGLPGGAVLDGSDAARSSQRNLEIIRQTAKGASDAWKNVRTGISRQVSTIQTDFSRAVVNIIRGTESIGEAMRKVGNAAVDGLLRTGIEFAVNEGIKLLGKLLTSMGGIAAKIGGILGGSGGGGTSGGGGGAQGGVGSAVSAASGGILGMVTSIGSLVSGVIGSFQMAGMNKTLDLIEKEVRYSQIHLLHILEKQNEYLPKLKDIWESLIRMETMQMSVAGGGANVTINVNGGDPRQMLEAITRELKQLGVIPK